MLNRCENKGDDSFHRYGGRGITVCARWRESFEAFLADVGQRPSPRHSIDRINNNGNYEPGNCRWATRKEQQRNLRSNRVVSIGGVAKPVAAWAEELELGRHVIIRMSER